MKIALVIFVVLGTAFPILRKDLSAHLNDFMELLPIEEISAITRWYLNNDRECQMIPIYLQDEVWTSFVAEVTANPIWQELKINASEAIADIEVRFDGACKLISGVTVGVYRGIQNDGKPHGHGIRGYLDELMEIIPFNKLLILLNDKLQYSADFKKFWDKISCEKAHVLADAIRLNPQFTRITYDLLYLDVDLNGCIDSIYDLFGWK